MVPTPPMLAPKAMARMMAEEKSLRAFSERAWDFSATSAMMLTPIGSIITVAAVLLTHMLRKAVVSSTPPTSMKGRTPAAPTTMYAKRRCRPLTSMARPMSMPPRKRKMMGSA